MTPSIKFWCVAAGTIAITLCIISGLGLFFWHQLALEEKVLFINTFKQYFIYIFSVVILILAGLGFALDGIIHIYILPVRKLIEGATLIHSVNPSHRIKPQGSQEVKLLAKIINEWGDRFEALQKNIEQEIRISKAEMERERNILAAFMAELPEGVLICNAEGRILLYNNRAKEFFAGDNHKMPVDDESESTLDHSLIEAEKKFVGLGRSIFSIIDKNIIVHALDEIADKLNRKEVSVASYFVVVTTGEKLLRVEAVPILNNLQQLTGFVLIFSDITEQLEKDNRVDFLLQSLIKGLRASVGGIRSAIETILAYPDMNTAQLDSFREIIHQESMTLSNMVDKAAVDYPNHIHTQWPLVPMLAKDMVETIKRKAEAKLDIVIHVENSVEKNWIKVDSYSIVLAILFVLNQLKQLTGCRELTCKLERKDRFVNLDLFWRGKPIMIEHLRRWDEQVLMLEKEGLPLTLKEVIGHHEAGIWSYSSQKTKNRSYLRLLFPAVKTAEPDIIRNITILTEESRPVFYDFDLFSQPNQIPELDDRLVTELEYTVFDTETTGLDPRGGDEIISIGAVRIINCRLLYEEFFDQLIDPQRAVPRESTRIHGIQPEMVKGQPTIDKVLPLFQRFCENTVLVAHNAAFDMLMLKMKEATAGVTFINPVLDTLLLSDLLHPAHKNHDIETIARRLGISVVGRHTALGDAIATGEMFLKMIPLLGKMGIYTLKEARLASQKTYHARLKY